MISSISVTATVSSLNKIYRKLIVSLLPINCSYTSGNKNDIVINNITSLEVFVLHLQCYLHKRTCFQRKILKFNDRKANEHQQKRNLMEYFIVLATWQAFKLHFNCHKLNAIFKLTAYFIHLLKSIIPCKI